MAKEMVYFNATKQIETITIHYNQKLDATFADDVAITVKEIAKKMRRVDLKNPKEFYEIQVYVYPSKQLFYKIFGGEIEKRFYRRKRSMEDLYVVQDGEGNIHIVSPRGMDKEKRDAIKKILVMKILGEYMEEKEKTSAERLLKEAMKPKQEEVQEVEEEVEPEQEEEPEELEDEELQEDESEDLDEEDVEKIIETELVIEQIDEESEQAEKQKGNIRTEAQEWLSIGWLAYVKGKLKKEEDIKRFANNISKKGVKKLGELSTTRVFENYNFSEEYACALVEYIVEEYGMDKFTEFYKNPKDIQGVFGVSKFIFNNRVKAFIYSRYNAKEMKMEIDQKKMKEITEIHFAKGGGANITIDKEIEAPTVPTV